MSKTRRRKKCKVPEWTLTDWTWQEGYHGRVPMKEPERSEAIAKFYSDNGIGHKWPVPSWYKRMLNNEYREKSRREVQRLNNWKDYEEYNFEIPKNSAGYYW